MAYSKRIPPITVELTIEKFNSLIEYLSNIEDGEKNITSNKLKEKLLQYSIPNVTEDDTTIVIRFFNQEATQLISLLIGCCNQDSKINYYELLLENRKRCKEGDYSVK